MFTEENEKRGFPLKDFLLKLILVIIFVLLLMWLIPWPNNDSLKDQIFKANLQDMKEAAATYFTTERLPQNVGDRKTITLQEMLNMKLLIPFVDKDGKSCDVTNSYVTLEKLDDEYLMKINLKCSGEEDYILVHMGCYSYCATDICEKKEEPTASSKPNGGGNGGGNKPKPTGTAKPTGGPNPSTDPTPTVKPTTSPTPTTPPDKNKEYEYKKYFQPLYTAWSVTKEYAYKDSDNIKFEQTDTRKVINLGKKKIPVGTQSAIYEYVNVKTRYETRVVDHVTYEVCTNWKYIVTEGGNIQKVETDWYDTGERYYGFTPPSDTANTKYEFEGVDWTKCGTTCVNNPYLIFKVYKRRTTVVGSTSNPSTVTGSCTQTEKRTLDVEARIPYSTVKKALVEPAKTIYGYVKFYSVSTRKITQYGYTQYLWSSYNDMNLLNQGYTFTGKDRYK